MRCGVPVARLVSARASTLAGGLWSSGAVSIEAQGVEFSPSSARWLKVRLCLDRSSRLGSVEMGPAARPIVRQRSKEQLAKFVRWYSTRRRF